MLSVMGILGRAVPVGRVGPAEFVEDFVGRQPNNLAVPPYADRMAQQGAFPQGVPDALFDRTSSVFDGHILTHGPPPLERSASGTNRQFPAPGYGSPPPTTPGLAHCCRKRTRSPPQVDSRSKSFADCACIAAGPSAQ